MSDGTKTLYERLGGYNAIAAVASDLAQGRSAARALLGASWGRRCHAREAAAHRFPLRSPFVRRPSFPVIPAYLGVVF
jgi:hypothetical protein